MNTENARRPYFALIGLCAALLAAPLLMAAPVRPGVKPKAPQPGASAPADKNPVPKKEPAIGERILGQLLSKLERPSVQLRVNMGNDGRANELKARAEIPLKGDVSIPLQDRSGSSQVDKLIPTATLRTAGLVVRWSANTDAGGNVISNDITFHDKTGAPAPLVLTLRSELTDLLDLRIESIRIGASGFNQASTDILVDASCGLRQSLVDLETGRIAWEDATCTFKGKYVKNAKKFTYRFVFDSF